MTPITGEISLFLELDIKEKRVTISDYSLVDISFEISNISFTPRDFLETILITRTISKDKNLHPLV